MTAPTTTRREVHDEVRGAVRGPDSPAVSAPARVIPATQRDRNEKPDRSTRDRAGWSPWTAVPASLQQLWQLSKVDPKRVPAGDSVLAGLWQVSNWADRLLWFALALICPAALTGAVRWAAERPSRRWITKLVLAALTGAVIFYGKRY